MTQNYILLITLITIFFQSCIKEREYEIDKKAFYGFPNVPVKDIDGNEYKTVQIGKQIWMAENYKATRLNDGTVIKKRYFDGNNDPMLVPWYCWPYDDTNTYRGVYYSWYVVNTEKLCPVGWHVPHDTDWFALIEYLGGADVAGQKLKSKSHWIDERNNTNISGFDAKPAGMFNTGSKTISYWWSSTIINDSLARIFMIKEKEYNISYFDYWKYNGLSVRCIKNE